MGQARNFDRVADGRSSAVPFDVGNAVRVNICQGVGECDHFGVAINAGRGEAGFAAAVIVQCRALNHGADGVSVADRVLEAFEDHHAKAVGENCAARIRIIGAAVAIRRV